MFGAGCPMPAIEQKETIHNLMQTALGEDCDYEVISTVHEKIVERIEQNASDPNPLVLTKQDMVKIMSDSGASEEAIVAYEKNEEADIEVLAEMWLIARNLRLSVQVLPLRQMQSICS